MRARVIWPPSKWGYKQRSPMVHFEMVWEGKPRSRRLMIGLAQLVDGLVAVCSLTMLSTNLHSAMKVRRARRAMRAFLDAETSGDGD